MLFDPARFRRELSDLLDRHAAAFNLPAHSHALLRRQLALGDPLHDRRSFPGHVTTSAFILDGRGNTLLVRHRSLGRWLQPGGHYEAPDSLAGSALREAREETGLSGLELDPWHATSGVPIDIDTHRIPARPDRDEPEHWHHDVRYVVRAPVGESLNPALSEVDGAAWHPASILADLAPQAFLNLLMAGLLERPGPLAIEPAPHAP